MIDTQKFNDEKNVPFYAWECVTILMKKRNLDLIIKKTHNL